MLYFERRASLKIAPRGFEPLEANQEGLENTALTEKADFVFDAGLDSFCAQDADLAAIVRAWSGLPAGVRQQIKRLAESGCKGGAPDR